MLLLLGFSSLSSSGSGMVNISVFGFFVGILQPTQLAGMPPFFDIRRIWFSEPAAFKDWL
jgi:hypothetical protein